MNSDSRRELELVLEREIEIASQLAMALEAERKALTAGSPELVAQQAAQKAALVGDMERLEIERLRLSELPQAPLSGVEQLAARWTFLTEIMRRCRSANEVNGYIMNVRRSQVSQLLNIIRGTGPQTYGPHGRPAGGALRELARA